MKYILNNDNLEVVGKQYLQGVGGYDGTNTDGSEDVATVINDMPIIQMCISRVIQLMHQMVFSTI